MMGSAMLGAGIAKDINTQLESFGKKKLSELKTSAVNCLINSDSRCSYVIDNLMYDAIALGNKRIYCNKIREASGITLKNADEPSYMVWLKKIIFGKEKTEEELKSVAIYSFVAKENKLLIV